MVKWGLAIVFAVSAAGCASSVISDTSNDQLGTDATIQQIATDAQVPMADARPPAPTPDAQAPMPDAAPAPPACTGGDGASLDPATNHCYLAFTSLPKSWIEARMTCAALGPKTQLATLTSQAETDRVNALLGASEGWMGFDDSMVEGSFVWVTGEPTAYTYWAPGEPNNGGTSGEDCALTNRAGQNGHWDDRNCTDPYAFVCERVP